MYLCGAYVELSNWNKAIFLGIFVHVGRQSQRSCEKKIKSWNPKQPVKNGWKWWFPTISYMKIWFIIQLKTPTPTIYKWLALGFQGGSPQLWPQGRWQFQGSSTKFLTFFSTFLGCQKSGLDTREICQGKDGHSSFYPVCTWNLKHLFINGCFNWMIFTKSLYRKWLEITISIHLKLVGFRVPGTSIHNSWSSGLQFSSSGYPHEFGHSRTSWLLDLNNLLEPGISQNTHTVFFFWNGKPVETTEKT